MFDIMYLATGDYNYIIWWSIYDEQEIAKLFAVVFWIIIFCVLSMKRVVVRVLYLIMNFIYARLTNLMSNVEYIFTCKHSRLNVFSLLQTLYYAYYIVIFAICLGKTASKVEFLLNIMKKYCYYFNTRLCRHFKLFQWFFLMSLWSCQRQLKSIIIATSIKSG